MDVISAIKLYHLYLDIYKKTEKMILDFYEWTSFQLLRVSHVQFYFEAM